LKDRDDRIDALDDDSEDSSEHAQVHILLRHLFLNITTSTNQSFRGLLKVE
jgi:hypothetical protein